jgi:hypothetical protein
METEGSLPYSQGPTNSKAMRIKYLKLTTSHLLRPNVFVSTVSKHLHGVPLKIQNSTRVQKNLQNYIWLRIRFPAGAGNFSLHHCVQNGTGAHPDSYPMGNRGPFPGGKAAGAWSWQLTSI